MTEASLNYLEQVLERSKERRRCFFGDRKTTKAETAEIVLLAYIPELLAEIRRLRVAISTPGEPK